MKTNSIFRLLLVCVVFAFCSCITDVEFKGEDTEPYLVVNSIAEVGTNLSVEVSESAFMFQEGVILYGSGFVNNVINNAHVVLVINGQEEMMTYDATTRSYLSQSVINAGDSLDLRVEYNGKTATSSIRTVSSSVPIKNIDLSADVISNTYMNQNVTYHVNYRSKLQFEDPVSERNYYSLMYNGKIHFSNGNEFSGTPYYYFWDSVDWDYDFDDDFDDYEFDFDFSTIGEEFFSGGESRLLEDGILNGTTITVNANGTIKAQLDQNSNQTRTTIDSVVIDFNLYNYDRLYYLYAQSVVASEDVSELSGLLAEPVQIFSNIDGGIGIFASKSTSKLHLVVNEEKE